MRREDYVANAAADGLSATRWVRWAIYYDSDRAMQIAVTLTVQATSFYHEGLRESGECPMCGSINTDPWGGRHRNDSMGCCLEPPERTA